MKPWEAGFEVDFPRLRRERLARLQGAMGEKGLGALVLTQPVNIRYATGTSVMPLWTAFNIARYAIVPASGDPVVYEYGKAMFRATEFWPQARVARPWQFRFSQHTVGESARRWAEEVGDLMKGWGVKGAPIGIDTLDAHGFHALSKVGPVVDGDETLEHARLVKTDDEIALIAQSCRVGDAALGKMEAAIRPGITENQLLGTFWGHMLSLGGEHCSTRLIVAGERTNPWFFEATDHPVAVGDLVAIDTDMAGPEGYLCDVSRTFLCGDRANADQREAYGVARDFIEGTLDLCRPGVDYREVVERAPKIPAAYEPQGYSCMVHGDGMDDEPPFLPFPVDAKKGALIPHGGFVEGMVVSVEFYAGKVGARDGVKLEEQALITKTGPLLLSRYPFHSLLGAKA